MPPTMTSPGLPTPPTRPVGRLSAAVRSQAVEAAAVAARRAVLIAARHRLTAAVEEVAAAAAVVEAAAVAVVGRALVTRAISSPSADPANRPTEETSILAGEERTTDLPDHR